MPDAGGVCGALTMALRQRFYLQAGEAVRPSCVVTDCLPNKNNEVHISFPFYERFQFLRGPPII